MILLANGIDPGDVTARIRPNAPNRACAKCGTAYRARLVRCPECASADLAVAIHAQRADGRDSHGAGGPGVPGRSLARWKKARAQDPRPPPKDPARGAASEWAALRAELGIVALPYSGRINRPTLACRKCGSAFRPRPVLCPKCGSDDINRIVYGMPTAGMCGRDDGVSLGGCVIERGAPGLECQRCMHGFGPERGR